MKIKENLILDILSNDIINNKYTKAILNLKTIISLETEEGFVLSNKIKKLYDNIIKKENCLIKDYPLKILENEFYKAKNNNKRHIDIMYNGNCHSIEYYDLYIILEAYYEDIYTLVSIIGNFYNLDIKIKQNSNTSNDFV
ncbi:hypothetical protein EOM09_08030 [bacterium]|nr:hypothetical protein [bacterium]